MMANGKRLSQRAVIADIGRYEHVGGSRPDFVDVAGTDVTLD